MKTTNQNETCTIQLHKKENSLQQKNYEAALTEAIDAALEPLGPAVARIIYTYMERSLEIKKQEIPNRPEDFTKTIEQIFGEGATLIEIRIMEELHKRFQDFVHFPKKRKLDFTDYLNDLQTFLRMQSSK
ncbi:MAG: NitrOD5 domain-containing protein [Candidatus Bathyarchaeota archaeon]|nr:NitrOD5 domain-containing protein [Candidatus Bathyarchaeota archaeon]